MVLATRAGPPTTTPGVKPATTPGVKPEMTPGVLGKGAIEPILELSALPAEEPPVCSDGAMPGTTPAELEREKFAHANMVPLP